MTLGTGINANTFQDIQYILIAYMAFPFISFFLRQAFLGPDILQIILFIRQHVWHKVVLFVSPSDTVHSHASKSEWIVHIDPEHSCKNENWSFYCSW